MQTGSAASLTDAQITDISHFIWDRINNTLRGSPDFDVKDVLTGDPAAGQAYFNGEGRCATCHSPTGDLAGMASGTRRSISSSASCFPRLAAAAVAAERPARR